MFPMLSESIKQSPSTEQLLALWQYPVTRVTFTGRYTSIGMRREVSQ